MLGREVTYNGECAIVLNQRIFPLSGKLLAIQRIKSDGSMYKVSERPKGFKQYEFISAEKVVEGVDS